MLKAIKKKTTRFTLGLIGLLFIFLLQGGHIPTFDLFLTRVNGFIYDSLLKLHLHKKEKPFHIVIIDVDDLSIQKEGRWPWPRDKLILLLENLKKLGTKVVAFDIVFSDAEKNTAEHLKEKVIQLSFSDPKAQQQLLQLLNAVEPYVDNDKAFAQALAKDNALLGYLFHYDPNVKKGVLPQPLLGKNDKPIDGAGLQVPEFLGYNGIFPLFLKTAPHAGFVSSIPDLDGVIRHGLLLANYKNKLYPSLSLATVMNYLAADKVSLIFHNSEGKKFLRGIKVKNRFIPTNNKGQILVPYWGLPGTIDYYSASDVLHNTLPPKSFSNAIVIVGSTMVLLADLHQSPVSQTFPGVEINANMIAAMLTQQVPFEFSWNSLTGFTITSVLGGVLIIVLPFLGPVLLVVFFYIAVIIVLLATFLLFIYQNIYIVPGLLLLLISLLTAFYFVYNFVLERRQKNRIKNLFGQYVPLNYVKKITESSDDYSMAGETRNMTVFFADIRNFTTMSEVLDAAEVKRLLNVFFSAITDIIFAHKGTVDKYVGDMVMAFWGAPIEDSQHGYHGISAALSIKNSMDEINQKLRKANLPPVNLGMGLATGLMNVGDMGSKFRRAYTVIGDTVNLASRLQELTKFYHVSILVSDSCRLQQDDFLWRPIDKISAKGRHATLTIYEPLGYKQDATQALSDELSLHEEALQNYYARNWSAAKQQFSDLLKQHPQRYVYQLFLQRSEAFDHKPPPSDWEGVFVHTHK